MDRPAGARAFYAGSRIPAAILQLVAKYNAAPGNGLPPIFCGRMLLHGGETEQVDGPISARHVHSGIAGRSVQDRGIAEERDRDDLIFHSSPSGPFLSNTETIKLVLSILLLNCRTDCSTAR